MEIPSASSTARNDANACVVVHTPQIRCTNAQRSRGSRSFATSSMPRQAVPEDNASSTLPLASSTFISTRK